MSVFAVYNIKGGVGKTAAAVNLSWLASHEGARTLIWDLDPQAASSFYFRVKPKVKGGVGRMLEDRARVEQAIRETDYDNLDLLPADFSYRKLDLELDSYKKPLKRVRRLLKPLARQYDHVFIDCAPSISLVSENVFQAADVLLVPVIPTTLSVRTLDQLIRFMVEKELTHLKLLPFFSMVDRRRSLHVQVIEEFLTSHPYVLRSYVPSSADVEKMGLHRRVLADFALTSPAMRAFSNLWREIKQRLPTET